MMSVTIRKDIWFYHQVKTVFWSQKTCRDGNGETKHSVVVYMAAVSTQLTAFMFCCARQGMDVI